MGAAITTSKLSKRYHGSTSLALDQLTLSVHGGEVYGFLGSNGAGKSTTIRTLLNFIQPTSGSAQILDMDVVEQSQAVKQHVGYLTGEVALYPKATGSTLFGFLQALQPLKHREYYESLIERFEVELHKPAAQLSKGNRQKVGIVQALMHEPEVLILDEPTSGLDPLMQEVFFQTISECRARGAAVFISSHYLAEVQRMCDRVGIIKAGKLITEQRVSELRNTGAQRFTIHFGPHGIPADLSKVAHIERSDIGQATVTAKELAPFLTFLGQHDILRLVSEQADLEQEFLQFYGDSQ